MSCPSLQAVQLGRLAPWLRTPSRRYAVTWQVLPSLCIMCSCCRVGNCMAGDRPGSTVLTYRRKASAVRAVGGQSYRQCLAEIIQKHGHVGLYKGLTSGLVGPLSCKHAVYSTLAELPLKDSATSADATMGTAVRAQ